MKHLIHIQDPDVRARLKQKRINECISDDVITGEELMLMDLPTPS